MKNTVAESKVAIHREDKRLDVKPPKRGRSLAAVLAELTPLDEDIPEIDDPPTEPEDLL